jgi:hypothetical protein
VDFDEFESTLRQWVRQGFITQAQADAAAASVRGLAEDAEDADSKRVDIPVEVPGAVESRERVTDVDTAVRNLPGRRDIDIVASDRASSVILGINNQLARLPQFQTVTVTARYIGLTSGGRPLERAHGGPVSAGRLYEVAEHGKAELLRMGDRTYLIPGQDGYVDPSRSGGVGMSPHAGMGGGMVVQNTFNFPNYVGNRSELVSAINHELDRGARLGAHGKRGL